MFNRVLKTALRMIRETGCVCVKCITLCNCLCSSSFSSSGFSVSFIRAFGILNWYSWFWESCNMVDWESYFSFSPAIHVIIDIRPIRPMTIKFGKQVHPKVFTQIGLIKQELLPIVSHNMTLWSSSLVRWGGKLKALDLHYHSAYGHQLCRMVVYLDGFLPKNSFMTCTDDFDFSYTNVYKRSLCRQQLLQKIYLSIDYTV